MPLYTFAIQSRCEAPCRWLKCQARLFHGFYTCQWAKFIWKDSGRSNLQGLVYTWSRYFTWMMIVYRLLVQYQFYLRVLSMCNILVIGRLVQGLHANKETKSELCRNPQTTHLLVLRSANERPILPSISISDLASDDTISMTLNLSNYGSVVEAWRDK